MSTAGEGAGWRERELFLCWEDLFSEVMAASHTCLPLLQRRQRCLPWTGGGWQGHSGWVCGSGRLTRRRACCVWHATSRCQLSLAYLTHPAVASSLRRLLAEAECRRTGAPTVLNGPIILGRWFDSIFHCVFQPAFNLGQPYLQLAPGLLEMTQVGREGFSWVQAAAMCGWGCPRYCPCLEPHYGVKCDA